MARPHYLIEDLSPEEEKEDALAFEAAHVGHSGFQVEAIQVCDSRNWASPDPKVCACGGSGYWSSPFDTWEVCPYHSAGKRHPDDYEN
jgi:hypothetical protein